MRTTGQFDSLNNLSPTLKPILSRFAVWHSFCKRRGDVVSSYPIMGFRLIMKIENDNPYLLETRFRKQKGFSLIESLIVIAIIGLLATMGVLGITRARASMRLSGAAREYAAYIEKVRIFSIRHHADTLAEAASVSINDDRTSYSVTFDFDGDGTMETRTIRLPDGVLFGTVEAIAFDWRGRTWNTVGGLTREDAQVSITLSNEVDSTSVDVTGSGDVTIDSQVFDDDVPNVTLNVSDLATSATPNPTPTPVEESVPSGSPSPTPADTDPLPTPSPSATPVEETPLPDPTPSPSVAPSPTPTPSPTPSSSPTPTPTPVVPCLIMASPTSVTVATDGAATIQISHNSSSEVTITGTSSKPSDLQVAPGSQTVTANGTATFTVKSKKLAGAYSANFAASCGSIVVSITVQ
jgi:prepilin-type N-terminal cleavage/methylation domain-containing protein